MQDFSCIDLWVDVGDLSGIPPAYLSLGRFWTTLIWLCPNFWRTRLCTVSCLRPSRRHRQYYRISSSSFPGPYSVPPGVTSVTLEKASKVKKGSVSLSASQVSSLETMLSGVCEVASWLDWWLSTCGGFRENLPIEVRADFKRLILSGSRALEFLASQGTTALGNLPVV